MMNIFYIQRLLFLCVILLHSAEKSAGVMACQQWVYGSGAPLLDQTEQYCSAQGVDARVCPATNVGGEVDGAWGQDRLNPAENAPWPMFWDHPLQPTNPLDAPVEGGAWMQDRLNPNEPCPMFWDHPLQPTNPLDAPVEDDAWMYGSGAPLINQTANWCSYQGVDERVLPAENALWPMLLDHPVQPAKPLDAPVGAYDVCMHGSGVPLINQTAHLCSAQEVDERVLPAENEPWPMFLDHPVQPAKPFDSPVVAGDACMQDRLNPEAESQYWQERAQFLLADSESGGEVDSTYDIPNIAHHLTSSYSPLKQSLNDDADKQLTQSLNDDADKIRLRGALRQQKYRAGEILLRAHNDVPARFRHQIGLRIRNCARLKNTIAAMLSQRNSFNSFINIDPWQTKKSQLEQDMKELKILEAKESDNQESRLTKIARLQASLPLGPDGEIRKPSEPLINIEQLRELTKYKVILDQGVLKAVQKSSQSRVTCGQDMDGTGASSHALRDGEVGKYTDVATVSSADQDPITAMARSGVRYASNLDGLNQGAEVGFDPLLAGPVSGGTPSDAKEYSEGKIKTEIDKFLKSGTMRAYNHARFLKASNDQKSKDGAKYDASKDIYCARLAGYRRTRKDFLVSLVHDGNVRPEVINSSIRDALKGVEKEGKNNDLLYVHGLLDGCGEIVFDEWALRAAEAHHLLGVGREMVLKAKGGSMTAKDMALDEYKKRAAVKSNNRKAVVQRKRHAPAEALLDEGCTTPQNKRCS